MLERFIWRINIKRINVFIKIVTCIHLAFLITVDIFNYTNGVWDIFPSQYYVFSTHLLSLPILGFFIVFNSWVLRKGDMIATTKLKWLLLLNLFSFVPIMIIYYYWDLVDYGSSGIMMIYISAVGFLLRFKPPQIIYMTVYLGTFYFGMLFAVQIPYSTNPSLYLNGIVILFMYYFFSKLLYKFERSSFKSKMEISEKNEKLRILNDFLSESQKNIERQNATLKQQNGTLNNFAQIVAHDVKAPLKMIQSFSEEISKKYQDSLLEKDKPLFDYICRGSKNLIGIVDGLYDFTQISINDQLNFKKVDFNITINDTKLLLSKELQSNNVKVVVSSNFPLVEGVEELLQNVLLNLFCNAIKFKKDGVDSVVELFHNNGGGDFVEICMRDNGIGIPEDAQNQVFQLFKKLHLSSEYEGFGLGLATCKKIIEKHGGNMWITSKLGEGTSVFFTVPAFKTQFNKENDIIQVSKSIPAASGID